MLNILVRFLICSAFREERLIYNAHFVVSGRLMSCNVAGMWSSSYCCYFHVHFDSCPQIPS